MEMATRVFLLLLIIGGVEASTKTTLDQWIIFPTHPNNPVVLIPGTHDSLLVCIVVEKSIAAHGDRGYVQCTFN